MTDARKIGGFQKDFLARKAGIMMTIKTFVKRHAVLTYFALTLVISTGGILIAVAREGMPINMLTSRIAPLALFAGPSVAGLLLTGLASGRAGFRELFARLFRWRVGARWYAVALLTVPLVVTPILLALSLLSPEFLPALVTTDDKASLLLLGAVAGVMGGFLEELGWTGFAVPRLRLRHDAFTTGLIVGAMWAVWHVPVTFWSTVSPSGAISWPLFLPPMVFYVAVLPAFRVLMVWVYDRTESLLVAMLMHGSLSACTFVILLPPAAGMSLTVYYFVLAAVLWIVVAAVQRRQTLSPQGRGVVPG
jgi:membrane protease YdiL (CAAX protease family)